MTDKIDRDAVAAANGVKVVSATDNESADFWLVSAEGDSFPVHIGQLHAMMHALHDLHDQVHHH